MAPAADSAVGTAERAAARLSHEEAAQRRAGVEALGQLGAVASPYVPALLTCLREDVAWAVRAAAAEALGRVAGAPCTRLWLVAREPSEAAGVGTDGHGLPASGLAPPPRTATVQCLDSSIASPLCSALAAALRGDVEWPVRSAAAEALGALLVAASCRGIEIQKEADDDQLGEGGTALVTSLEDEHEDVRQASLWALVALGPQAARPVAPLLSATQADTRQLAAELLGKQLGAAAAQSEPLSSTSEVVRCSAVTAIAKPLAGLLQDEAWSVRGAAAAALSCFDHVSAADAVASYLMEDDDDDVRLRAVEVLGALGLYAAQHAAVIAEMLADPDSDMRRAAAEALQELGPEAAAPHAETLAVRLRDPDEEHEVCCAAAAALGRLGAAAAPYAAALVACMGDERERVRELATAALGGAGEAAAVHIVGCLGDARVEVRRAAVEALGMLGPRATAHNVALTARLGDADATIRKAAADALREVGPAAAAAAAPVLARSIKDEDRWVRRAVARALGALLGAGGDDIHDCALAEMVTALAARLRQDEASEVRWAAARALAELRPADAAPHAADLADRLANDTDWSVRRAAADALARLGPAAAGPHLAELARRLDMDPHPEVRRAAAVALGAQGASGLVLPHAAVLARHACEDADARVRSAASQAVPQVLAVAPVREDEDEDDGELGDDLLPM